MPYVPLRLAHHTPAAINAFIRSVIDSSFRDFRFLALARMPDQGAQGSLQRPMATLLLAATDGTAQFLCPGKLGTGRRFQKFLKDNYPWDLDQPEGLSIEEACAFLWHDARCPLIHSYGVRRSPSLIVEKSPTLKLGNLFAIDDKRMSEIEQDTSRPFSKPSLKRGAGRTVFWIETFYWGLRRAIERALDTPEKCAEIDKWIKSGTLNNPSPK